MKKVLISFICVMVCMQTYSQTTVSGRVVELPGKAPLAYASISFMAKDGITLATGAICNEKGRFETVGLKSGEYIVLCSFLGYTTQRIPLLVGELNQVLDLGDIGLKPESVAIEEVTIVGARAQVAAALDKKSYSMSDHPAHATGSVLDAMKSMPGISVDQEGKIVLRGSDKVAILIDGKQSSLTGFGNQKGLDNIPSSSIERIEIINNPSAKYDAAGMAGIVNIIYKKEKRLGFNGDVGFTYGLGMLSQRREDLPTTLSSYHTNSKYTPSLNLNYKKEHVHLFLQSSVLRQHRLPNNEFTTRYYDDGSGYASQVAENRVQTHYNVKAGIDWEINARNSLTVFGVYDYEHHRDTSRIGYFDIHTMESKRDWSFDEDEMTGYANVSVGHKYRFEEVGHEWNTSFQYTKGWEDETYNLYEAYDAGIRYNQTHVIAPEHTFQLTTDYARPLRIGRLETGAKGQLRHMPITYDVIRGVNSPIYEGLGDWSNWSEKMASAYLNLVIEQPKYDIEAGLRAEYTSVKYEISPENIYYNPPTDSYDYFELFPNIRLTYKINSKHRFSAFYNRRIDRPSEGDLRIFPKYDDPELLKVGNPYLRPQYTQNVELAYKYIWGSGSVFVAGYHKMIDDSFTRIYAADERNTQQNIINKVYQNTGQSTNTGVEIVFDQKVTKYWSLTGSANWYKNKIDAYTGMMYFPYERPFRIEASSDNPWYAKLSNQLSVWDDMTIQLSGSYFAPKGTVQGEELSRWGVDMGLKKAMAKGKVELTLSATDIFNTMGIRQQINGDGFKAVYENFYETQIFSIGVKVKL